MRFWIQEEGVVYRGFYEVIEVGDEGIAISKTWIWRGVGSLL